MIVSFLRKLIFVKTRKTAGTSIEIALAPFCGPRDILTPITPEDEILRLVGGRVAARNYADAELEARYGEFVLENDAEGLARLQKKLGAMKAFYNHMPARDIRSRLDPDFWATALKFTVERHPYEKAVSRAYFSGPSSNQPGRAFSEVLDRAARTAPLDDTALYTIDGELAVDIILRQESLATELPQLARRVGVELTGELPRAKGRFRTDRRPARDILTAEQKSVIYERCRRTFDLLGYEP